MKALYRRYRPKTLSEVVGQKQITDVLERAIQNDRIAHAYLFIGPRGTGKTSVARILAHEVNGFPYELEDDYIDIIEIDAASNTGVDNIRELREKANIAPAKGKYKVYIIDEVHMLSKSAFNALLKTLEEPPAHVIFIMATTEKHKVPVTILSRSQVFQFRLADPGTMFDHLKHICKQEQLDIADDALQLVVQRGGGSYRDSLSLLEQVSTLSEQTVTAEIITNALGLPQHEALQQLLFHYKNNNILEVRNHIAELANQGVKAELVAEELIRAITADPEPALLPLLDRLTKIEPNSSYAEVKLLLALSQFSRTDTQNNFTPPVQSAATPIVQTKTSAASTTAGPTISAPLTAARPAATPTTPTATTGKQPATASSQASAPIKTNASGAEIWQQIHQAIGNQAKQLNSFLKNSDYVLKDGVFKIYTRSDFKKRQFEKKRDIIAAVIPEQYKLEISDETLERDSELAAIADLMGGGEEIEINE